MTARETFGKFFDVGPEPAWSSYLLDQLFDRVGSDEVVRGLHTILVERAVPLTRVVRNLIDDVRRGCYVRRPVPAFEWLRDAPRSNESAAFLAFELLGE